MKFNLLTLTMLTFNIYGMAQVGTTKKEKNVRILPFPAVSVAPETGFLYGAGAASTFRLHPNNKIEKPSSINGGLAFTTKKQLLSFLQFSIFDNNRRFYFGEIGYYKFSFFYYGIGQNEVPEELYIVNFPRIRVNTVQKINESVSIGIGVQYEQYDVKETKVGGQLASGTITGSDISSSNGLGILAIIDTRDSIFFPRKGLFANVNFFNYGRHFGGTHNFSKLTADVAFYKKLHSKLTIATQVFHAFAFGSKIPFQQLPQIGGPKAMRGYYQGRFTDKNLSMWQTEFRLPIYRRFGLATFGSAAMLGDEKSILRLNDIKYSYGAGLRFTFNRKEHLNLRLDYALGKDKNFFYITVGEAF